MTFTGTVTFNSTASLSLPLPNLTSSYSFAGGPNNAGADGVTEVLHYNESPYAPTGLILFFPTSGQEWGCPVTSFTPLPPTLTVGDSGQLMTVYCSAVSRTYDQTYTVTADTPTSVLLTITTTWGGNGSGGTFMDSLTYRVSAINVSLVSAVWWEYGVETTFN